MSADNNNKVPLKLSRKERARREFMRSIMLAAGIVGVAGVGYYPVVNSETIRLRPPGVGLVSGLPFGCRFSRNSTRRLHPEDKTDPKGNEQQNRPWHGYGNKQQFGLNGLRVLCNDDDRQDSDDGDRGDFPAPHGQLSDVFLHCHLRLQSRRRMPP